MRLEDALSAARGVPPPAFAPWPRRHPERQALDRLGQIPPFTLLSPNQLSDLAAEAEILRFNEATPLFDAQAPTEALYVMLRGTVGLQGPDGVIVDGISAPGILGVADLFSGRHMFSAQAMAASTILKLPRDAVIKVLEHSGTLANAFLGLIAANTQALANALMAQRCLTGVQRLAAFLLEQAERAGAKPAFALDIPKKAIAGHLGMTPAHFARSLTRLVETGMVGRHNRNTIILNDISALRRLVEGELGVATQDGSTAQHRQRAAYRNFRNV